MPDPNIFANASQLTADLKSHGAVHCDLASTELHYLTHLVADTPDFPAYEDAINGFIHVVKPLWIEFSIHKNRAANPRSYRPDPSLIMSDAVVVIAEDVPSGDKDAIMGGMQAMGGLYSPVVSKLVTHVFALSMDNAQCKIVLDKNVRCSVVLPHWFDQCLRLGKKIDLIPYTLPDPPILNTLETESIEAYVKDRSRCVDALSNLTGATLLDPRSPLPTSPSKSRRELSVFRGRSVLLSTDLDIASHLRGSLTELIRKGAGEVVDHADKADTLICRYRGGLEFSDTLEAGKDIGNLNWLYHLINTNKWIAPTRRLLHYPVPKKSIHGFKSFKISVSNYTGEARIYLESLIRAAGGTFTKTMTQNNTHLITAHTMSEKVDAAREWKIEIVNHLWLEESYAKCKVQSLTDSKYCTFPERTNLGEVIGQTPIDKKVINELFLPQQLASPEPEERAEAMEPKSSNARTPGPSAKIRKTKNALTPAADGKENVTPGSRGAKDRALSKLHLMAGDIAQYQKEMKRRGGVLYGGRKATDPDRIQSPTINRKRASIDEDELESSGISADVQTTSNGSKQKRAKTSDIDVELRFVVTGGKTFGWNSDKSARLRKLGLEEIDEVPRDNNFQVLVSPQVMRTPNFLAAVAAGATIVRADWLEDMIKMGQQIDTKVYELEDPAAKKNPNANLVAVCERARQKLPQGGMLNGMTVYCTDHVTCGMDKIVDVVERNGGTCVPYRGRETKPPENTRSDLTYNVDASNGIKLAANRLFLVSVPRDKTLWKKFKAMATDAEYSPAIVTVDWILQVALRQDMSLWTEKWALD